MTFLIGTVGLFIGATLAYAVGNPAHRAYGSSWPIAWSLVAVGLALLTVDFNSGGNRLIFGIGALFCYAAFSFFFIRGLVRCLRVALDPFAVPMSIAALVVAIVVELYVVGDTRVYFAPSLIVTFASIYGLYTLSRARSRIVEPGTLVVGMTLASLALSGLRYIVAVVYLRAHGAEPALAFWASNSVADVILVVTLAVGAMLMTTDRMRAKLQRSNVELAAAMDRLETIAKIDPLTGVSNRYSFYLCLDDLGDLQQFSGCLIMVDVNGLKAINDVYGHVAGDRAIRAVADRLRSLIRLDDRIFRWGGDEFVVLLFNTTRETATERLDGFGALRTTVDADGTHGIAVSVTWGIAPFGGDVRIEDVLKSADSDLYSTRRALQ